ncbi:APC family permease [Leucobacter soli]|uniref:Putrescine importer PuuP n=1 Tax=Leucobacter soli TaxID=2812850 RepID=A0A916NN17_9MICO|nr:APC family permease [Leucobacter soli]CAG7610348.1 Putrescine importer PuuP [Leucobacter soli]
MTSTDTTTATEAAPGSGRLRGNLGPLAIVFMVVAAAAPLTILVSSPTNMINGNGAGLPVVYFVVPLLLLLFAPGFAAMTRYVPKAGAFYSYVTAGLGRKVGVGAGFIALTGYLVFQSFVFTLMGMTFNETLVGLFGENAFQLPWYVWTIAMIVVVAILGISNIDVNAKVLSFVLIAEVVLVIIMNIAILVQGGTPEEGVSFTQQFTPEVLFSGSVPIALLFGFSIGLGFEATAIFRDEARDPEKTIPRAIYIAILSAAVFYFFALWGFIQGWGTQGVMELLNGDETAQFWIVYETASIYVGTVFMQIMQVVALTSMFACVLAYHNIAARYLHSMGHSVLPQKLSFVHQKSGAPYIASLTTSAIALIVILLWLLSGIDPYVFFGWEIALGSLALMMVFVLTSIAIFIYFRKNPDKRKNVWVSTISPLLAFLVFGGIMVNAMINFSALSGAVDNPGLNTLLMVLPVVFFLVGVGAAAIAEKRSPERYAGLIHHE